MALRAAAAAAGATAAAWRDGARRDAVTRSSGRTPEQRPSEYVGPTGDDYEEAARPAPAPATQNPYELVPTLRTSEMRWFAEGDVPPDVETWFVQGDSKALCEPTRVDHYCRLVGCASAAVKLRGGRFRNQQEILQVKQQTSKPKATDLGHHLYGNVDGWEKYTATVVDMELGPGSDRTWVRVEKARTSRLFSLDDGDDPREVNPVTDPAPKRGVGVELTSLKVGEDHHHEHWWTLGLEAYGADPHDSCVLVAKHLFAHDPPPKITHATLRLDKSMCYARWLDRRIYGRHMARNNNPNMRGGFRRQHAAARRRWWACGMVL